MRAIRNGGSWLHHKVRNERRHVVRRSAVILGLLAVIGLYCFMFRQWNTGHWFILALVPILWSLWRRYDKADDFSFQPIWGWRLERKVAKELSSLSDDYVLVQNWDPGCSGDVDAILFGPHGALVIEAKYFSAPQVGRGKSWFYVSGGRERRAWKNPVDQVTRGNRLVQEVLQSLGYKCFVRSVIVVAESSQFEAHDPAVTIVRRSGLLAHVASLDKGTKHSADELADALMKECRRAA
ncbi:MAG: nuclease-related domain-containing protein [Fimbriimonadaceae bacterium]